MWNSSVMLRWCTSGSIWLAVTLHAAAAEPVRLGIWSAPEQAGLGALVASMLSKDSNLVLLERDELGRIGNEAALNAWFGKKTTGRLEIPGVDGLLFLSTIGEGESAGRRMRLVAVKTGTVIGDVVLPASLDIDESARPIVERVLASLPKLRRGGDALALSILNLRSVLSGPEWQRIESELTTLLESRIASESGFFLLDRRTLDELEKEKRLGTDDTPFRGGVWLVDGTIGPARKDGRARLEIAIRLRRIAPPVEIALTIRPSADALPAAADEIFGALSEKLNRAPDEQAWDRDREAGQFVEEAVWAWRRKEPALALQAIGAARALGDRSPDLLAMRITLLCPQAAAEGDYGSEFEPAAPVDRAAHREAMEIFAEAMADWELFRAASGEEKLHYFDPKRDIFARAGTLRGMMTATGLRLLRDAIALDGAGAQPELRDRLRAMTSFDPAHGKISGNWHVVYDFAGYLAKNSEELFAYYQGVLAAKDKHLRLCATALLRVLRSRAGDSLPPHLEPDRERRNEAFAAFQKRLLQDPETALCALFLRTHVKQSTEEQVAAAREFLRAVYDRGEELLANGRFPFWATSASNFDTIVFNQLGSENSRLVALYLEKATAPFDSRALSELWTPGTFARDDAPELWRLFSSFRERMLSAAAAKDDPNLENKKNIFTLHAARFAEHFPDIALGAPALAPDSVKITRFWEPDLGPDLHHLSVHPEGGLAYVPVGGVPGAPEGAFYEVDLRTMEGRRLPLPVSAAAGGQMVVTPSAAFAFTPGEDERRLLQITRYDAASGAIETKSAVAFHHQDNRAIGGDLYLNLWTGDESGFAKMHWPTGETTILASSRRRPALNQFDDCESYMTGQFFAGPKGRPCVLVRGQPYYIREDTGEWARVLERTDDPGKWPKFSEDRFWEMADSDRGALLYSKRGDFLLLDPAQSEPVPLIVSSRTAGLFPKWAQQSCWEALPFDDLVKFHGMCISANERGLFALYRHPPEKGSGYYLRWFRKSGSRAPLEIALDFSQPASPQEIKDPERMKAFDVNATTAFSKPMMRICDAGLLFTNRFRGFWFLPFSDLEQAASVR